MKKLVTIFVVLSLVVSVTVLATTWGSKKIECPICKAENDFNVINSYGSYIYGWASKYQYIYWPKTDSSVLYSCKDCKLTTLMWDFKKVPEDKFDEIKKALKDVELKDADKKYTSIPMVERLKVAEIVYKITKPDDLNFWCEFYRIVGYHESKAKNETAAKQARLKSLEIVEKLLEDEKNKNIKKEYLYIKGAMLYFTDKINDAPKIFEEALKEKYNNPELKDEQNAGFNEYLDELMKDYIAKIKYVQELQTLIDKVLKHKWLIDKVNEIKLEENEKFTLILPKRVLKEIVGEKQPFSFKINEKATMVIIGSADKECKNKIEITDYKIKGGQAIISVKINESNLKEFHFEKVFKKVGEYWKLIEKE